MDRTVIWNKNGRVAVQVYGNRIFDSRGSEIGWIEGEHVYDKTGRHIGWFAGGLLRDSYGKVLGFSEQVTGQPHPPLPHEREGAPPSSLQGSRQGKPGLGHSAPGRPLMGGKPPLGGSWSDFDAQEYFDRR
ncbi:MAG: hypothetical protein Q8Q39_04900 [bacterium]|nr:hypothetical protein [bacterium]